MDLVDALREGVEPELSALKALRATELIFGTYESSRRRERIAAGRPVGHLVPPEVEQALIAEGLAR